MPKQYPTPYKFILTTPSKYVGDVHNIWVRSSWEKKAMIFFDTNPNVLQWNNEEVVIPYLNPLDNSIHRYFPDFMVKVRDRNGNEKQYLVEVKPASQTVPPKQTKRKTKRLVEEMSTYLVNEAKWKSAREWCQKHGIEFMILTEKELGIK